MLLASDDRVAPGSALDALWSVSRARRLAGELAVYMSHKAVKQAMFKASRTEQKQKYVCLCLSRRCAQQANTQGPRHAPALTAY